jgi:hypothetical protein
VQDPNPAPVLKIGKAHQRLIRENLKESSPLEKEELIVKNAIVKEIPKEEATKIILKYEWLGTMANTSKHYGIYFNNYCAGAVCYGSTIAGNANIEKMFNLSKGQLWLLARGACVSWSPINTNSKLIGESLKLFKQSIPQAKVVIAFADPSAGEIGTVYQATNWIYIGQGRSRTCVITKDKKLIHSRQFSAKNKGHSKIKLMEDYVKQNPGSKILWEHQQPKKGRYIYLLGTHKENKEMKILLQQYISSYPKRGQND